MLSMVSSVIKNVVSSADGLYVFGKYLNQYNGVGSGMIAKLLSDGRLAWLRKTDTEVVGVAVVDDGCLYTVMKDGATSMNMLTSGGSSVENVGYPVDGNGGKVYDGHMYELNNEEIVGSVSKVGVDGKVVWRSYVNGLNSSVELNDVCVSSDGYVYAVGVKTVDDDTRPIMVKWDKDGKQLWWEEYETNGAFNHVCACMDEFVYATGYDHLVTKWSSDGELIWSQSGGCEWYMGAISVDVDGSVYVTGRKKDGSYLFRWSSDGDLVWIRRIDDMKTRKVIGTGVVVNTDGVYVTGLELCGGEKSIAVLCKWSRDGMMEWCERMK